VSISSSRREFFGRAAGALAAASLFSRKAVARFATARPAPTKPALLGGTPVHSTSWPKWPEWRQAWEPSVLQVLRSGEWYRGSGEQVPRFEAAYAQLLGAKRCLATASGTTALIVGMHVLDVDAGDEVIVSPFTFMTVAMTQNLLLAEPTDIDHIAEAIRRIQSHGAELART